MPTHSEQGFIRAMARELLVHRSDIKNVDQAVAIAEELIDQTSTPTHTVRDNDHRN